MRKTRKFGVAIASLAIAALMAFAPVVVKAYDTPALNGYTPQRVEVTAQRPALNGWQWYFYDGTRKVHYDNNAVKVSAEASQGYSGGNALVVDRLKDDGIEAVFYSYNFDVTANKQYQISYRVKFIGNAGSGRIGFSVEDAGTQNYDLVTFDEVNSWRQVTFTHTAKNAKIGLKFSAGGIGKFIVSDITVKEMFGVNNTINFGMQSIGKISESATDHIDPDNGFKNMTRINASNLSNESSDGDGYSLKLNDGEIFKTNFSAIDQKKYRFSFKYKMVSAGSGDRISIRFNNWQEVGGGNKYYLDVNPAKQTVWTEASFEFYGHTSADQSHGFAITAYANYLIDEISLVCVDQPDFQLVANGSFSGACLNGGWFLGDNSNVAKQPDGTYAFVASNATYDSNTGNVGYASIDLKGLESGKQYTISFDYRVNNMAWASKYRVFHNDVALAETSGTQFSWGHQTINFTAAADRNNIKFYGPVYFFWAIYYKNVQVTDGEGKTYISNPTLVNPGTTYGANVFPYGTFAGDTASTVNGWTLENGAEVQGFTFEDGNNCYSLTLGGSEESPAKATSAPVAVTADVIKVSYKTECGNENVKVSLIANGTEIMPVGDTVFTQESGKPLGVGANVSGRFTLPAGTTSVQVVFKGTGYAAVKHVDVQLHVHGATCETEGYEAPVYTWSADNKTCTATVGACKVCGRLPDNPVTETVNAVITDDTATYFAKGTGTYTATFTKAEFTTQSKQNEETPVKALPVKTYEKVSARVSAPYGLRWTAGINKELWNEISAYEGVTAEAGVLIAPYDYVTAAGEFTMDALTAKGLAFKAVDFGGGFNEALTAEKNDDNNCWYGALVNIQNGNLDREFAGRAYVKLTDGENTVIHYGNFSYEDQVRTFEYICKSVVADATVTDETIKAFAKEQLDKIVNVNYESGTATIVDREGYATPYAATVSGGSIVITLNNAAVGNLTDIVKIKVNGTSCAFNIDGTSIVVTFDL